MFFFTLKVLLCSDLFLVQFRYEKKITKKLIYIPISARRHKAKTIGRQKINLNDIITSFKRFFLMFDDHNSNAS